jgi:hydrogenase maturation protease
MDEAKIGGPEVNPFETLVLGLGNILWADEGFGVRTVEALNAAYRFPDDVRLMDGGTQGIFLLPWVRAAKRLLILDAIDFGLEPGELRVMHQEDVPRFMGVKKVSMQNLARGRPAGAARRLWRQPAARCEGSDTGSRSCGYRGAA